MLSEARRDLFDIIHIPDSKHQTFLEVLMKYKQLGSGVTLAEVTALTTKHGTTLLHECILNKRKDFLIHLVHVGIYQELYVTPVGDSHPELAGSLPTSLVNSMNAKAERDEMERLLIISKELAKDDLRKECLAGDVAMVKALVQANPAAIKRCAQWSTLYCAVVSHKTEIVSLILEAEAKLSPLINGDEYWQQALRFVIDHGQTDILPLLCDSKSIDLNAVTWNVRTVLEIATLNGDKEMFLALKKHGAALGNTLPSLAATAGHTKFLQFLLEYFPNEVDLNERDRRRKTPLHFAVEKGHAETVKFLLANGACVTALNRRQRSVFHAAAEAGQAAILELLIAHTQERNTLDQLLSTRDCYLGSELCFLVRGQDQNKNAWHYVLAERALLKIFREKTNGGAMDVAQYGRVIRSGWGTSPSKEIIDEVETTYDMVNMPPGEMQQDMTALHLAILKDQPQCALKLLEHTKEVNTPDHFGLTPMHMACVMGNAKVSWGFCIPCVY